MIVNLTPNEKIPRSPRDAIAKKLREKIKTPCEKILLIHPQQVSEQDFFVDTALRGRYWTYPPYSCGVLVRNFVNRGYQADILDLNLEILRAVQKDGFVYSVWKELLKEKLISFKPDIVGISCMFSMSHEIVKEIINEIKQFDSSLPVICGGVHMTDSKRLALENCPEMDFMGVYECDSSFPDLIDFVNGKLPPEHLRQIATLIDGQYVALEQRATPTDQEISTIPLYNDLPIGNYSNFGQVGTYGFLSNHSKKTSSVLSKRGCRAHCSFCTVPSLNGPGVRIRDISGLIEEIKILYYKYGIRHISWLDDDLLNNSQQTLQFLWAIADLKLDLTWDATNGLIAAAIKEDVLDAMVASGCIGFNLGIESGNPQRLYDVHKPGTVKSFRDCKKLTDKYPQLFIKGFLIIGFPDETLAQLLDTVNLALELQLDWYSIQILNPIPSTEIYNSMVQRGLIQDALNTNKEAYIFGPNGRQRITEEREKLTASEFFNLFSTGQPDELIRPEQLEDYLVLMDYKINYEIIFGITHPVKLTNKDTVLKDICERIAPDGPMGQLFYGITRKKLGDDAEAQKRAKIARELLSQSAYWQKRFEALDLYSLLDTIS